MDTRKMRVILIAAYCFVVALCSDIKSVDNASDIQEITSFKLKNTNSECYLDSLKSEIGSNSSSARLILNQDENKDQQKSWVSYISYPIKSAINKTYNIADFAIKHPTQTIITSLLVAAQFTAVAAECNCMYVKNGSPVSVGMVYNESACKDALRGLEQFRGCY